MRANLTAVTLGVRDLPRSLTFYRDGLGWTTTAKPNDPVAFFPLAGVVLALYPRKALAQDANVPARGSGFSGITLAFNARDAQEVDASFARAIRAGGRAVKRPKRTSWGGYGGYFADPDGHLWEVVYNPFWKLNRDGTVRLPRGSSSG